MRAEEYPNSITDANNMAKLNPPVVAGKCRNDQSSQKAEVTLPNRGQSSTPYTMVSYFE